MPTDPRLLSKEKVAAWHQRHPRLYDESMHVIGRYRCGEKCDHLPLLDHIAALTEQRDRLQAVADAAGAFIDADVIVAKGDWPLSQRLRAALEALGDG